MYELTKQFRFDAAHRIEGAAKDDPNTRIHGHSYRAEVSVRGEPDTKTGMVVDFDLFEKMLADVRDALDHRYLNDVAGLGTVSMESMCKFIWDRLASTIPTICKVSVSIESSGDSCAYFGSKR